VPFSRLDNIYSTVLSTWLLYAVVIGASCWLFYKSKPMLQLTVVSLLAFTMLQAFTKFEQYRQKKIIIYNIPQHSAVDFIFRDKYVFSGDSILQQDGLLQNFHLKPSRITLLVDQNENTLNEFHHINNYWQFFNKKIIMIDSAVIYQPLTNKLNVDILIISRNPNIRITSLTTAIRPSIIVFDSSNSLWKIGNWKKECLALALPCFSIPEQGAFVLNIE
jgi:competence protein ComEC